jgi:3,4-dihydroxy 2-butanone 4-phosphate synthase/GTP cyclohydrolase II
VSQRAVADARRPSAEVEVVARTRLPTRHGQFGMLVFRHVDDPACDHVVLTMGDLTMGDMAAPDPLVRVHSECLTGEVLGSLRCDCAAQLDDALGRIAREGRGVLVYLRQEGRGIGLAAKLNAYALQDRGLDTVEANVALGLPVDGRRYHAAAGILATLGVTSVRLLTNNPDKLASLASLGIAVSERVATVVATTPFNRSYLESKRDKLGHRLSRLRVVGD